MRIACALIVAMLMSAGATLASAKEFAQKWVYASANFTTDAGAKKADEQLDRFKKLGATHLLLVEAKMTRLYSATPEYFQRARAYQAKAKDLNITIVPCVYPIGYSGTWFHYDANLASGIPVKNAPFIVSGSVAQPDPANTPKLEDEGFEKLNDDTPNAPFIDWKPMPDAPGLISADKTVKHSGNASLKLSNLDKLPKQKPAEPQLTRQAIYLTQTLKVKPFQYYRVSLWAKTQDLKAAGELHVSITSQNGLRRHTFQNTGIKETQDWTQHFITFNTFEAEEITFGVGVNGAKSGTIWYDDVKIEPAGLLLVLRRDTLPFVVTSEDGKTVYEEGRDYKPVRDPCLSQEPFPGEFTVTHKPSAIVSTYNSRITEGQKLLVSYYHMMRIYSDQEVISLQDPRVFDIMEDQVKRVVEAWPTANYMMGYDEVRAGGFEPQPNGEKLTPGQLLARHTKKGYDILRKHSPQATIYAWSDMYTPYHNARPFDISTHEGKGYYYITPGTFEGAWEGLPKDVVVMNWYSPDQKTIKFFADRGHKQVLCGYYDASKTEEMQRNIATWLKVSQGVPDILGFMYTTWSNNYDHVDEYFKLLSTAESWTKDLKEEPKED